MRVDLAMVPALVPDDSDADVVVVIDVLRATTTILTMLDMGVTAIYPVVDLDEARNMASENGLLLAGERAGLPPMGFDFGNSPVDLRPDDLSGRAVVLTTTNGSRAITRAASQKVVLTACIRNITAAAAKAVELTGISGRLQVMLSGHDGEIALDDVVCAGLFLDRLLDRVLPAPEMSDAALLAHRTYLAWPDVRSALYRSASGQQDLRIGHEADIEFAACVDASDAVPIVSSRDPLRLELIIEDLTATELAS